MKEAEPQERGVLAEAFWSALEAGLADPSVRALAEAEDFAAALSEKTSGLLQQVSAGVFESLMAALSDTVAANRKIRRDFEATVERAWRRPLELPDAFYGVCVEAGDSSNRRYRDRAFDVGDYSWQAIVRLHARSCLVMSEVLALLRTGHASGAHARWRTLHELAVVAWFLRDHDDEVSRRYLEHDRIQAYKSALAYSRYAERLGEVPLSDHESAELRRQRNELVARYGLEFEHDYGWAASVLRDQGRTFAEIERATQLDHTRPYYKMASHAIHPTARGRFFDLGVTEEENLMLAGPSTRGLADPGWGATLALYQTTIALLGERPTSTRS